MQIEITETGCWTDADGNRWRLVPEKATAAQSDAALARAQRWGGNKKSAKALAWEYLIGYQELVEHSPVPVVTPKEV